MAPPETTAPPAGETELIWTCKDMHVALQDPGEMEKWEVRVRLGVVCPT